MDRILVSACLLGAPVRYDGRGRRLAHPQLQAWAQEGRLCPFCPELAAGFGTPRPAAEIRGGDGAAVLAGRARVVAADGADLTAAFLAAAEATLAFALAEGLRFALLAEGSPSCGSAAICDGSFSGRRRPGAGVTAARLAAAGLRVFSELQIEDLARCLDEPVPGP